MHKTKKLIYMSLLIAFEVILTRFFSIQTPIIRIGFGYIPVAVCGMLFGPVSAGICGGIADVIGATLFPSGAFFPGFTLSAVLGGVIYGFFLNKKQPSVLSVSLAVICITFFVDICLNTIWLSMIMHKAALALLMPRLVKNLIEIPIRVGVVYAVWRSIEGVIKKTHVLTN